jgi:hypothetical protein
MIFSKNNKTRSSRKRSRGKRIFKKRNIIGGGFSIYVICMISHHPNQNQTQIFNVNPTDTIHSLSLQIQNWCKVYAMNQDIYFNNKKLNAADTIQGAGITQNSTIQLKYSDVTIQPPAGSNCTW